MLTWMNEPHHTLLRLMLVLLVEWFDATVEARDADLNSVTSLFIQLHHSHVCARAVSPS